jgi:hypothetical protein
MLNAVPSHVGERGLFDVKTSVMTFLPLSAISPDAQAVQEKYLAQIQARIDGGDCPPGLRKQYEVQLERIKAQAPSHEMILYQALCMPLGERDVFINPPRSSSPSPTVPDPKKKYASLLSLLNHPFSRGSIVRVYPSTTRYERILNFVCSISSPVIPSNTR